MSTQKIPLEALQKIRQYIKGVLTVPESENHPEAKQAMESEDELPEPDSLDALGDLFKFVSASEETVHAPNNQGEWFISAVNPGSALMKLPGLELKPGLRLVTYLQRLADRGSGITYAVPEDLSTTAALEQVLDQLKDPQHTPVPSGALEDVMAAIAGDFSPPSFVVASLLLRELKEFGALGKQCDWTHHRLINAVPGQVAWKWRTEAPKDLSPKVVVLPDGRAAVELFSCRVVAPVAIFRHVDQYPVQSYQPKSVNQAIATA